MFRRAVQGANKSRQLACGCWRPMVVFAARRVSHTHLKRVIREDFVFWMQPSQAFFTIGPDKAGSPRPPDDWWEMLKVVVVNRGERRLFTSQRHGSQHRDLWAGRAQPRLAQLRKYTKEMTSSLWVIKEGRLGRRDVGEKREGRVKRRANAKSACWPFRWRQKCHSKRNGANHLGTKYILHFMTPVKRSESRGAALNLSLSFKCVLTALLAPSWTFQVDQIKEMPTDE